MYDMFINDESRPLPERRAYMVLSHVPQVRGLRIDSIERCVSSADGHEVVVKSCGSIYRVMVDRDYGNPVVEKQEVKLSTRKPRSEAIPLHSKTYERLSAQLFPTLA